MAEFKAKLNPFTGLLQLVHDSVVNLGLKAEISGLTEKATIDDNDLLLIENSSMTFQERKPRGDVYDYWSGVASDSDGSNLIACSQEGKLYTSSDFGETWTERKPAGDVDILWMRVASDSDGSNLMACSGWGTSRLGKLYTSSDFGETWAERRPVVGYANAEWSQVASDSDGSNLMAVVYITRFDTSSFARVYTSSNFGESWTERKPAGDIEKFWSQVASDSDGSFLVATVEGGNIYISADYGETWTEKIPAGFPNQNWWVVDISSDGNYLIAGSKRTAGIGRLFTSSDFGDTWTQRTPAGAPSARWWMVVAINSDGSYMIAGRDWGRLYISTDFGVNWSQLYPAGYSQDRTWTKVDTNSDGSRSIVGSQRGIGGGVTKTYLDTSVYFTKAKIKVSSVVNKIKADSDIADAITKKHSQNTDTGAAGNFDIVGEISIKVYTQGTEPDLTAENRMAIWVNSSDNYRVYLIFRRTYMSGYNNQVKVELT